MRIYEAPESEWEEWDEFNRKSFTGNFFQTSDFAKSLREGGMSISLLLARDEKDKIVGGSFFYMPFQGGFRSRFNKIFLTSGPVISDLNDKDTLKLLLKEINNLALRKNVFEIELRTPFVENKEGIFNLGYKIYENAVSCSFVVDLEKGKEGMWNSMEKRTRVAVKKSKKEGVIVKGVETEEEFEMMYDVYRGWSLKRSLVPHSKNTLRFLWKLGPEKARIAIAVYEGKIICESIFLIYGKGLSHFSNSTVEGVSHLYPNQLIIWETMLWAQRNGFKSLDLYGSPCTDSEKHPNHGLYLFKRGFGGKFCQHMQYYQRIISPRKKFLLEKLIMPLVVPLYNRTR